MRETRLDALVVGAGFSGLYALHRLRALGLAARLVGARRRRRHLVLEPRGRYRDECDEVVRAGYRGFLLSRARQFTSG